MDEKKIVFIIIGLLFIGSIGVFFMAVPWLFGRGFSNLKETLFNDGLLFVVFISIGYGVYLGTKTHKK